MVVNKKRIVLSNKIYPLSAGLLGFNLAIVYEIHKILKKKKYA